MAPDRYVYPPVFEPRLALVLTDPLGRSLWHSSGLAEDIGATLVTYWEDLPAVPGKQPGRWRRLVVTAEPPFVVPGVVLIDGRLDDSGRVIEIRAIAHVRREP